MIAGFGGDEFAARGRLTVAYDLETGETGVELPFDRFR